MILRLFLYSFLMSNGFLRLPVASIPELCPQAIALQGVRWGDKGIVQT
jgi:hypothetical protein